MLRPDKMSDNSDQTLILASELMPEKSRKDKKITSGFSVADTRYDIPSRIIGDEKLRNVSLRLNIFAIQTELDKMSLTKMYNTFILDNEKERAEKLMVMNWRHAFQTALVWLVDAVFPDQTLYDEEFDKNFISTNHIIYKMGKEDIQYLNTEEFKSTLLLEGVLKYVKKYNPENELLLENLT